ncbi:DsrE/DsrF/DrsH-like family protein [Eudoraea sp.]|jgi:peroxiredoxin family protein|uniref:DsrE/DsrF/DrsH-like family protein n=1 Tax=Eudoraea sp. TaxID=1979955 RepID=UPI003C7420C4
MSDTNVKEISETKEKEKGGTKVKKMLFILSKGTIENAYAAFVMANGARMEGIESEIFFTFFGLEAIQKKKLEHLRVATVGNPALHMPTMLGGLPGVEALATKMMKKEMEKLDMPPIGEFLEILSDSGCKLWGCKLAIDMFHLERKDLIDELDGILTIGDFYGRANEEGTHLLFI